MRLAQPISKTELNNLVMKARDAPAAAKLLASRRSDLTPKQIAALTAIAGNKPAQKTPSDKSLVVPKPRAVQPVASASAALSRIEGMLKMPEDWAERIRNYPAYNDLWAAAGRPRALPKPRPFFSGRSTGDRYIYLSSYTLPVVYTLTPGQSCVIMHNPLLYNDPVHIYNTANLSAMSWHARGAQLDLGVGPQATGNWARGLSPYAMVMDSAAIKTEANGYMLAQTGSVTSPPAQCLGSTLRAQVSVPYNGSAVVRPFNANTQHGAIGRTCEAHPFNCDEQGAVRTYGEGFYGASRQLGLLGGAASMTVQAVISQFAPAIVLMGASDTATWHCKMNNLGDAYWRSIGMMDSVDAATNGTTGTVNNYSPRWNPVDMIQRGTILVENTSGTGINVTVTASITCDLVVLVEPDNQYRTQSPIMTVMRSSCQAVVPHVAPQTDITPKAYTGPTTAAVDANHVDHAKTLLGPDAHHVLNEHSVHVSPSPHESGHGLVEQAAGTALGAGLIAARKPITSAALTLGRTFFSQVVPWAERALISNAPRMLAIAGSL